MGRNKIIFHVNIPSSHGYFGVNQNAYSYRVILIFMIMVSDKSTMVSANEHSHTASHFYTDYTKLLVQLILMVRNFPDRYMHGYCMYTHFRLIIN